MRPTHKILLFAIILFVVFGTVPSALANENGVNIDFIDDPANANSVSCNDPPVKAKLGDSDGVVDYYSIDLLNGQLLKVDVDAEAIGSSYDYVLQLFDNLGNPLADSDDKPAEGEDSFTVDPYLEYLVIASGIYIVAVSSLNLPADELDPYEVTFECTGSQDPVNELQPGDLLASTGPIEGSLISIDQETWNSEFRFPLGEFGPVVEIEFHEDGRLFGSTGDEPGSIITIDPNDGSEDLVSTLTAGAIIALEFVGDTLYGILLDFNNTSKLVTIDHVNDGAVTILGSTGYSRVDGLAYDLPTGRMYGVAIGLQGGELITIDPTTGLGTSVGPTGSNSQIVALEFGPDGQLYGATSSNGGTLVTINTANGEATEVGTIAAAADQTAILAHGTSLSTVSGLAFVPGWKPLPKSKTITSLDNNPLVGHLIDKYKFTGEEGETVTITLKKITTDRGDEVQTEPVIIGTKSKWRNRSLILHRRIRGRAFLILRDGIQGVRFRLREKGQMPLMIEKAVLPATGVYYIILMQPVPRPLRVDYSLTLESSGSAFSTLEAARLIERGRRGNLRTFPR